MSKRHRSIDQDIEASKQLISTVDCKQVTSISRGKVSPDVDASRSSSRTNSKINLHLSRASQFDQVYEDSDTLRSGVTFDDEHGDQARCRGEENASVVDKSRSSGSRTDGNQCPGESPNHRGNFTSHKNHSRSLVAAPDGGWGWVVVFASFMISLIADGISFSFGIIFLELSDYFNESKSKTAFVGSLFMSIPLLVGPLASALTDRYGCRRITIVSGIISSFGFILGHMSTCIEHLFIAFSIAGAGLALSYVTSIVIVAYYFEKRRSLATGLAVCGTGFGTFIFPPLTIHLLDQYTWRGTLLIMSGFFLNIVVFGALMRDLPSSTDVDSDDDSSIAAVDSITRDTVEPFTRKRTATYSGCKVTTPDINVTSFDDHDRSDFSKSIKSVSPRMTCSMVHIPTYLNHRGSTCDNQDVLNELWSKKGGYLNRLIEKYPQIVRPIIHSLPRPVVNTGVSSRICPPPPLQPPQPPRPPPPVLESAGNAACVSSSSSSPAAACNTSPTLASPPPVASSSSTTSLTPTSTVTPGTATAGQSVVNGTFTTSNNGESFSLTAAAAAATSTAAATVIEKKTTDASKDDSLNTISPGTMCNPPPPPPHRSATVNNDNSTSNKNYNCTVNNYVYNVSSNNNNISQENVSLHAINNNNNNESTASSIKSPALISNISLRSPKIIGKRLSVNPIGYRLNSLIPFEHGSQAKKLQRGSITYRSAMLNIRRYRVRSSSCPDMVAVAGRVTHRSPAWLSDVKNFFHDVIDISIFRSLKYSLFCFSNLLLYACIDVPYVYIPDHAIMSGSSDKEQASVLISFIGMVNTAGIVLVGYVGDLAWISPPLLYSLAICLSGLSIFLIPIVDSYRGLAILSSLYGLTISANYALVSVILVELISLDKFTIGYGLLLLVQGIASLIGPPLAGWLCDQTGSYSVTFFATGICIFISGAIVLPISSSNGKFYCHRQLSQNSTLHSHSPSVTLDATGNICQNTSDVAINVTAATIS